MRLDCEVHAAAIMADGALQVGSTLPAALDPLDVLQNDNARRLKITRPELIESARKTKTQDPSA